MDNDGDLDMVVANTWDLGSPDVNRLYRNDGSGVVWTGTNISSDSELSMSIALGDMNGDGLLDVVVGNGHPSGGGQVNKLYLNDGVGDPFDSIAGQSIGSETALTFAIGVADMDGDGDLDVVAWRRNGRFRRRRPLGLRCGQ